jgi:hypothetical protein
MIKNKFVIAKFIQLDELIEQLTHKIVRYEIKLKMRLSLRLSVCLDIKPSWVGHDLKLLGEKLSDLTSIEVFYQSDDLTSIPASICALYPWQRERGALRCRASSRIVGRCHFPPLIHQIHPKLAGALIRCHKVVWPELGKSREDTSSSTNYWGNKYKSSMI